MTTPAKPTYFQVLLDPIARNYVVTIIGAVMVLFVVQLLTASMVASAATTGLAVITLILNKRSLPLLMLPLVAYFQLFPNGIPNELPFRQDLRDTHLRLMDTALIAATLVYVITQFRFFSLATLAVPEGVGGSPTSPADRRPASLMTESELAQLFMGVGALVLLAKFVWVLVAELQINFDPSASLLSIRKVNLLGDQQPKYPNPGESRLLLLGLLLGGATMLGWFSLWLRRARSLSREEASMLLLDLGWQEMRREAARQETWRAAAAIPTPVVAPPPAPKRPEPEQQGRPLGKFIVRWMFLTLFAAGVAITFVWGLGIWMNSVRTP